MSNIHDLRNYKYCTEQVTKRKQLNEILDKVIQLLHTGTEHRPVWQLLQQVQDVRADNINAIEYYGRMARKKERE